MKSKSKWFAIVLCVVMLAAMLSACGGAKESTASTQASVSGTAAAASTAEKTTAPAEKVKVTYSCWGTIEENKSTQDTMDKFNTSQDKITAELTLIPWESYVAQLNTLAAANNLPDSANLKEEMVKPWAAQNMLADVSGMYSDEDKPLDCITFKSADGKPVAYSVAAEAVAMYYNKAMFDKAKLSYPPASVDKAWTWDQFVDVAKKLTIDKNGKLLQMPALMPRT